MDGRPLTPRRGLLDRVPAVAFVVLCVGLLALFLAYPTYPNYDSYYGLLWAREVWDGHKPVFDAFRAPTEHPLSILFGLVLVPFGDGVDRVVVLCSMASVAALAAGMYQLARVAFNRWVGLVAGVLLVANWDLIYLAVRGYLDVTYMALVVWAAVLESRRRRRGWPVLLLLTLAGLLRPEAWVLCGLYGLWMAWDGAGSLRDGVRRVLTPRGIGWLALGCVATALWLLTDFVVTGNPLFSQTYTSGLAEELGRSRGPLQIPFLTISYLRGIDGIPLFWAGVVGLVGAAVIVPRRMGMPLILFIIGIGTFFLLGFGGFSVIDRYLLVPAALLLIFAAFVLTGWSLLPAGRLRWWWSRLAILAAIGVAFVAVSNIRLGSIANDLTFRGVAHDDLEQVLHDPDVQAVLKCGPLWTPNHKLVPDSRWVLDAPVTKVLPRSMLRPGLVQVDPKLTGYDSPDRGAARALHVDVGRPASASKGTEAVPNLTPTIPRGAFIAPTSRIALLRQGFVFPSQDRAFESIPPLGWRRLATSTHYAVYGTC
ncbi:hypothetical protein ACVU7I_03655 [Patulibacter sp. S7RM1-6]